MFALRDLATLDEFRAVERLEADIWGPVDLVSVPMLAATVHRGGVLIGAYDGRELVGFVYSFPALKAGLDKPSHWSHMLGVRSEHRRAGLGRTLKLAQRDRVLALGLDLIEWTFDPLQTANAHLNIASLGAIAEEYEQNVYGESQSPLHGGLPTDRFICQWWIRKPHVVRRLEPNAIRAVAREAAEAAVVNTIREARGVLSPGETDRERVDSRIAVDIPTDFTAMLTTDPDRALAWRLHTRDVFSHYLGKGYCVVDFNIDSTTNRGRYLLTTIRPAEAPAVV